MIVVRFRDNSEHEDLMKKVKKMRKFTEELEEMLEECSEEESDFRGGYRRDYDEDDEMHMRGRYGYRRGRGRM